MLRPPRGSERPGRWIRRLAALAIPGVAACNAIVGFGDLEKVGREPSAGEDAARPRDDATVDASSSSPDGARAAPSRCDLSAPFDTIGPLEGPVNSAAFEVAPSLTSDELTLVFQRTVGVEGGSVMTATRAATSEPFGDVTELTALASGYDGLQQPTMTSDGLLLFFTGIDGPDSDLLSASRVSRKGTFGGRRVVTEITSSASESFPGVTPDGAELWLSIQQDVGARHLFRSARDELGAYGQASLVPELASADSEAGVAFSADGLTIYFGSERAGGSGGSDVWTARRESLDASFGPATAVTELNTSAEEYPGWLSADGCRLYFGSDSRGGGDLLVASRRPTQNL